MLIMLLIDTLFNHSIISAHRFAEGIPMGKRWAENEMHIAIRLLNDDDNGYPGIEAV